jgi:hypothetical protein
MHKHHKTRTLTPQKKDKQKIRTSAKLLQEELERRKERRGGEELPSQ